ncbi:ribokinase [Nakamurella panacisegetis]|uniref:Ribokinase n=1 Tax=Nakamurella panacisegetis TaxID=1090615 RepID=A0A1H0ILF6_9ACTN|nr:ribokinase [Nakamurella panacisegetis]SDO32267.1 ribokinase [Nakamurella panacisegetis]
MTNETRVVVLGSVNMDLVTTTSHLPAPGETVLGGSFSTIPGGKGANQAIAAARAGGTVAFIGAVGDDHFGAALGEALLGAGVNVEQLRHTAGASGIAAIVVDEQAENTIVVVPGANGGVLGLTDADRDVVRGADILLCQLEIPISAVISAAGVAAAADVPVLLNPSPARDLPSDLLDAVTVLVVNEGEAAAIGDDALRSVPHLVITLGRSGARYRGPGTSFEVSAPQVVAIDTTGAGDAFTGALAVAWAAGLDPRAALQRACVAGALATTTPGAGVSAPESDRIDDLVRTTY